MLLRDEIPWGDWGIFSYDKFIEEFGYSKEFMNTRAEGYYDYQQAIGDFLMDREAKGDSCCTGLFSGLDTFARRRIPHRVEDVMGKASLYNPLRDNRAGARPSIPDRAPDIFKFILEGDEKKGHALIVEFDQQITKNDSLDDLFQDSVPLRKVGDADAHAVTIINRFPAYVRVFDERLSKLLDKIGFLSHEKLSNGKLSALTTIPFGINMVSFPFQYAESFSDVSVFDLYSILKSSQNALRRGLQNTRNPYYDLFFNVEPLAGGTIPRIHTQIYLRTDMQSEETYRVSDEASISMRDFTDKHIVRLGPPNKSWQAYSSPVKSGKYDVRLELLRERKKPFDVLDDRELWDLAEQLVYHSHALDEVIGIKARNVQIFPTGVIIRPFAVDGGHEKSINERIYGLPPIHFSHQYNAVIAKLPKEAYRKPEDGRGAKTFMQLFDPGSEIVRRAA